jgi:hypothetical protein
MSEKWYVANSSILSDIKPQWRRTGGGVTEDEMLDSKSKAYDRAIAYTEQRIESAKHHIKVLERDKAAYLVEFDKAR